MLQDKFVAVSIVKTFGKVAYVQQRHYIQVLNNV